MSPIEFEEPLETEVFDFLLYGPPGVGKTAGACSAPGPVLVVNAEPGNSMRYARRVFGKDKIREVKMTGAKVLDDVYLYLRDGGDGEKTVVLDSVGEAHRIVLEELCNAGQGGKPSQANYGDANTKIERFCRALVDLPINSVVVAHEASVKDDETGHFERLPITGTSNPALGGKLMAMVDVVAYCGVEVKPKGEDDRYVAQTVSANGRRGKDRDLGIDKYAEVNLSAWIDRANNPPSPNGASATTKKEKVSA